MKLSRIIKRFRIDHPDKFRLADIEPGDTCGLDIDKAEAKAIIAKSIQQLARRQDVLYAHNRWAVLSIFQAMDAAGNRHDLLRPCARRVWAQRRHVLRLARVPALGGSGP